MREPTSSDMIARILMRRVAVVFECLLGPSLVPIYAWHETRPEIPVQVGTGFLVAHRSRPVLLTAKHTLRGRNFQEDPGKKAVHVSGGWVHIGNHGRTVQESDRDIAAAYMDEFPRERCLAPSQFALNARIPKIVTMGGFLGRDFKRPSPKLRPKPYVYSNVGIAVGEGLLGMRYTHRRNIDTKTGEAAVTPIPAGLSGCPMVDTIELLKNTVSVVGLFTDQDKGQARGENHDTIRSVLALL
jgi:hypothetical protein